MVARLVYEVAIKPHATIEAINLMENDFVPYKQDEALASIYPKLRKPEDSLIDHTKPLSALVNEIRAADPEEFPAHFYHHGQKVCVRLWRPNKAVNEDPDSL